MTPYQEQKKKQQLMRTRALLFIGLCLVCSTNGIAQTDFSDIDARLREIYRQDQEVRQQWAAIVQTSDVDSIMSYQSRMSRTDSINQVYVFQLLDTHGWPQQVSDSAYNAIFLVIDHASIEAQKRYWPFIKEGSQKGDLSKADAATLQDRMLMREGKKQIYGTQTQTGQKDGKRICYVWPIEQPAKVDSLRRSVALPPMQEYLNLFATAGIEAIWDKELTIEQIRQLSTRIIIQK